MLEYLYTPWRESFLNRCFLQNDNLTFFYLLVVLQAQLLKACGTTPATPVKLRNASENLETPNVENNLHLPSLILGSPVTLMSDAVFHLDEKTPEAYGEEVSEQTPSR